MSLPSVKKLAEIFGDKAKEARRILESDYAELLELPENENLVRQCLNAPSRMQLRLNALNTLGQFHGVEYADNDDGELLRYLNVGDTYAGTLVYWRGGFRVSSLGDIVENRRNKFNR